MCKIISVSNQKGGVGKTTTSIHSGVALAKEGKKVLLVDFDPQANLTMALGYPQPDELELNIARLLNIEIQNRLQNANKITISPQEYIKQAHGIDFIPASIELSVLENILMNTMSRENILKNFLARLAPDYDYIFIDCPPSLNILTVNALTASHEVIIPVQPQYLSAKGLELLLQTIGSVKQTLNSALSVSGVLITLLDNRANFQKSVIQTVIDSYGENLKIFNSLIPLSVKVSEVQSKGETIFAEKNNKVAEGYTSFAKELIANEQLCAETA